MKKYYLVDDDRLRFQARAYASAGVSFIRELASKMGDMPNIEMPTMGGRVMWETVLEVGGWRLQVNRIFGNARILDENDVRVAWGSEESMRARLSACRSASVLAPGDVIGIKRPLGYEHYAVYVGDDRVIHYADDTQDFGDHILIHEAPMEEFLQGQERFFILDFPDTFGAPQKIYAGDGEGTFTERSPAYAKLLEGIEAADYHLYSPEETVERARSRIGEDKYDLAMNNCEHFAIWCKTGMHESYQVDGILSMVGSLLSIPMRLDTEGPGSNEE